MIKFSKKHQNKEAASISKQYSGGVALPTIVMATFVVSLFSSVLFLYANDFISPLFSTLLIAILTFVSYTPMHEAVHGNISGNNGKLKWLDKVIGYLMAPIISIPFTSHQKEHFAHHRHTNGKKDPDVHIKNLFKSPKHFINATIKIIKTQNTFVMNNHTRVEVAFSIGWRLLFVLFTGLTSIPVLLIGWFLGAFITIYLLSYKPHKPYKDTDRYKNTKISLFPLQSFEIFLFYHNLHAVHHLFPRVPFYNYRHVLDKIEPILRVNETPFVSMINDRPL
ncbi:MAG: beta-carotene hydroxylase [Arenicella sp.]|jgi:beta-carotene hydroxylase